MRSTIRYVGLDVHKETLVIAVAENGGGAPEVVATIANHWPTLHKQLKRLGRPEDLRCCYEAGPGYSSELSGLSRTDFRHPTPRPRLAESESAW